MKKRIFAFAVVVICLSILASTTLAYFTDTAVARNVITSGGVDIAIEEWQETPEGMIPYPDQHIRVMPATQVSKIVTVRNLDAQSFIRVKLELTLQDSNDQLMDIDAEEMEKIIHLIMNNQDWTEKDGWWYYGAAVNTNEVTLPLMTAVEFDGPNMTNEYQKTTLQIHVIAQAVQAANNGTSALEALGWSEAE